MPRRQSGATDAGSQSLVQTGCVRHFTAAMDPTVGRLIGLVITIKDGPTAESRFPLLVISQIANTALMVGMQKTSQIALGVTLLALVGVTAAPAQSPRQSAGGPGVVRLAERGDAQ